MTSLLGYVEAAAHARVSQDTIQRRIQDGSLPANTPVGLRDRALLLLGFAGAFRRSELIGLNVADVQLQPQGLLITLRRPKTDQEGAGRAVGISQGKSEATCPVRAYEEWVKAGGIKSGAVFQPIDRHGNVGPGRFTGESAAAVVKKAVAAIGLDADPYAGHSLRAGQVTEAARRGVPDHKIMAQTGHKSRETPD